MPLRGRNMSRKERMFLCAALALVFVLSVLLVPHVGLASPNMRSVQNDSGLNAVRSAPLTQVAGGNTQPTLSYGQYSVVPQQLQSNAEITVTLSLKAKSGFNSYINEVNNPASPLFRHYLTASEVGSLYGVSASQYSALENYFESYGLTVVPNVERLSLTVIGTPSQIDAAFHTSVQAMAYQYTSNGMWNPLFGNESGIAGSVTTSPTFYVASSLSLPSPIAGIVTGVTGLDGMLASPMLALPKGLYPGLTGTPQYSGVSTSGDLVYYGTSSIQNISYANYTYSYSFLSNDLYQFLYPSTMHVLTGAVTLWKGQNTIASEPDQGQGVTVAVIEVGFIPPSWLQQFAQQVWGNPNQITNRLTWIGVGQPAFNLPNTFSNWVLTGFIYGWSIETALDIEYIATMAPQAHIDVIAVGSPAFSAFDMAYAATAQYLSTGASSLVPSGLSVYSGDGQTLDVLPAAAASVSITSNSYGAPEWETVFDGSPVYATVENTLLKEMNAVGITNFFASGDFGTNFVASSPSVPAIATGSTAVGGGMLTAVGPNGDEFPVTNNFVFAFSAFLNLQPLTVVPAQGVGSFTYWAYGSGLTGTFMGLIGGGFGQSVMLPQPWWQNALDTYTTGARIDPVVSGAAAFNMTIYTGFWNYYYGGTSFATPITAGEWALIEEQANVAFGNPKMGDINPILYSAHNAYEAGVSSFSVDPYIAMQDIGVGFDWSPVNSFSWYYFNLSIDQPSDPVLPAWFTTLFNPAGSGWNFLQGLGMINVSVLDNELIGQVPSTQHGLLNEPFMVEQVTPSGLMPITTLQNGTTYTLQIVLANGQPGGYYNVVAYSGGPNNGTYGGGMYTMIQTSANGQFTYTPMYTTPFLPTNVPTGGSEYGYFLITSVGSSDWAFQQFAVEPSPAMGTLTIGVTNPYGQLETNVAEVPMFTTTLTGFYNTYGFGQALLNGVPVANAIITETVANVTEPQAGVVALSVIHQSYSPGTVLGTFLSDARGNYNFWTDALIAEINGPLYTQVVTLQASYLGLTSNTVTVYIEPQSGSFYPNVTVNAAGNALVGTVTFNDMKYVNYINISIGSMPGQFVNYSFMPETTINGVVPINLSPLPPAGTPIVLSMVAEGMNNLSFSFGFPPFFFFVIQDVQNPIIWSDPYVIQNLGPAPTASLTTTVPSITNGVISLNYAGSWVGKFSGTLTISSAAGTSVIASGLTSGSYALNTSAYMDGFYTITYTVTTSTGLKASSSLTFYFDNTQASLNALVSQLQSELTAAQNTINQLQSQLAADNATISSLQSQVNALSAQVSSLQTSLKSEEALYNSTYASLQSAEKQLSADKATISSQQAVIASLQTQLSADNATIAAQNSEISSLTQQVSTLQSELNAKKNYVPAAWYDVFGGAGALLLVLLAAVAGLIGALAGSRARAKRKENRTIEAINRAAVLFRRLK
jgi:subtilase family serine protease